MGNSCVRREKKSNSGEDTRLATSTGGLTTDHGLPDMDAMVGQGTFTGRVGMLLCSDTFLGFEAPLREKLSAHGSLPQRCRYYPSQSAKTLLKDFFDSNPPTVLDPGQTTTRLSADQMI